MRALGLRHLIIEPLARATPPSACRDPRPSALTKQYRFFGVISF
jgi:hypothetical protein